MRRIAVIASLALTFLVAGGAAADTLDVHLVSQTQTTITLGWTPQAGYGYLFFNKCVSIDSCALVSRTNNASASTVRFAKGADAYKVSVITEGNRGIYTTVTPPPTQGTISQTIQNGATLSGVVNWRAVYDANDDGVEDDPGSVNFRVDGVLVLNEINPPFGDTDGFWASTTVANGAHQFKVEALNSAGTVLVSNAVNATVSNGAPPPVTQCSDGIDNADPEDTLVDLADPGCTSAADNDETDSPPPGNATRFVATNGNDAGSCTQTAPCQTFNRAYQVASLGDTVSVAAGSYGDQTLFTSAGKTAAGDQPDVVFKAAGNVTVGGLTFGQRGGTLPAKHVTIDGNNTTILNGELSTFLPDANNPATDITIKNLHMAQLSNSVSVGVFLRGADRFSLVHVEIGPYIGNDGMNIDPTDGTTSCGSGCRQVTNILLDDVYEHDIVRRCGDLPSPGIPGCQDDSSGHIDCIQWRSGNNVTIRNSRFYNCSTSTWLIQDEYGGNFSNWTVENNMLGVSIEDASNLFRFACSGACLSGFVHLKHNTMGNNLTIDGPAQSGSLDVTVQGNLIDSQGACVPGAAYTNNVVTESTCSSSEKLVSSIGVNKLQAPNTDLHLQAGSGAIDATPCYLPVDIDGQARPNGAACDAGADER